MIFDYVLISCMYLVARMKAEWMSRTQTTCRIAKKDSTAHDMAFLVVGRGDESG